MFGWLMLGAFAAICLGAVLVGLGLAKHYGGELMFFAGGGLVICGSFFGIVVGSTPSAGNFAKRAVGFAEEASDHALQEREAAYRRRWAEHATEPELRALANRVRYAPSDDGRTCLYFITLEQETVVGVAHRDACAAR